MASSIRIGLIACALSAGLSSFAASDAHAESKSFKKPAITKLHGKPSFVSKYKGGKDCDSVPEIGANGLPAALALVFGAGAIMVSRRRRGVSEA